MFSLEQLLGFVVATLICVIALGGDNLSILSLGISRGRVAGMGFALGCGLGCLTHTIWATLGVTAILAASMIAFTVFKVAGAAYLIYLGIIALKSNGTAFAKNDSESLPNQGFTSFVVRGFIANAINPKVALFFLAFLPQFVTPQGSIGLQTAILGFLFSLITIGLFLVLGYFSGVIGRWLRARANVGKWLDRIAGGLFISLGIHLLISEKPA